MLSTTMEKFKKDTELDFPVLTTTTMEEVQNTKSKTQKNLDFGFCNLYTTRIGLIFEKKCPSEKILSSYRVWSVSGKEQHNS